MATKTVGALLIVVACILILPVTIGIIGGIFGVVVGFIGGVFGLIAGVFGAVFGGIFGLLGWIFDGAFGWDSDFNFFDHNVFTVILIIVIVALVARKQPSRR